MHALVRACSPTHLHRYTRKAKCTAFVSVLVCWTCSLSSVRVRCKKQPARSNSSADIGKRWHCSQSLDTAATDPQTTLCTIAEDVSRLFTSCERYASSHPHRKERSRDRESRSTVCTCKVQTRSDRLRVQHLVSSANLFLPFFTFC